MLHTEQGRKSQENILTWWMSTMNTYSQEWLRWFPGMAMGSQAHGMTGEQRAVFDTIAERHSEILQQMLTMTLQTVSLNSEIAERYIELFNKLVGIKT